MAADVVMFSNIPVVLTYSVPPGMEAMPGCRVTAPVRSTLRVGVVIEVREALEEVVPLKDIHSVLDDRPLLTPELIGLVRWTSGYYHAGIGPCMALAFPPALRRARGVVLEEDPVLVKTGVTPSRLGSVQKKVLDAVGDGGVLMSELAKRFPGSSSVIRGLVAKGALHALAARKGDGGPRGEPAPEHSPDQRRAIQEICAAIEKGGFRAFLLHGITGSGKTEVYLSCALEALRRGRSVLYLVPEIALTAQTVAMIRRRIPEEIAVFHSGLPEIERARAFLRVAQGGVRFVLGTRSAVFAPLTGIGLVVVDEEHDHSYKQDEGVPYNARDLGVLRASNHGACVVLGSATPSLESYEHGLSGKYGLLVMGSRVGGAGLPRVRVVDMRSVRAPVSDVLVSEMKDTLERHEQVLLFINRRGYSAAIVCPGCGKVLSCVRCKRSLTYHRGRGEALCHWCGFSMRLPEVCPFCGCLDMKPLGIGTEQVIDAVRRAFPEGRLLRMDSDEMTTARKLEWALERIRSREVDIVVGTQMIAKGHDFPHLTLVGVVYAEQLLHLPDFRSGERMFQQIVQVAGRAGRRKSDTQVIIQTLIPDHPLIEAIAGHDYRAMVELEAETRRAAGFPPYAHLARCVVSAGSEQAAREASLAAAHALKSPGVEVIGPAPAPISLIRNRHRWHLLTRSQDRSRLHRALSALDPRGLGPGVQVRVDVDPYTML
ncbi:MAG TPA: primosomal protein N' [Deltaproteobacteria bacterium]|nr:primosomal protein N' [Deltaproteobacteria bacterium]HPP80087.1 primosomal protein N' [Deltaproteobacteria bacterium]